MVRRMSNPTGRRFYLSGAKHEDGEISVITVGLAGYKGVQAVVEFDALQDAEQIATLLVDIGAFSSIEVVESHGFFVKRAE